MNWTFEIVFIAPPITRLCINSWPCTAHIKINQTYSFVFKTHYKTVTLDPLLLKLQKTWRPLQRYHHCLPSYLVSSITQPPTTYLFLIIHSLALPGSFRLSFTWQGKPQFHARTSRPKNITNHTTHLQLENNNANRWNMFFPNSGNVSYV